MTAEAILVNRLKRRPNPVDPEHFSTRVTAALAAFRADSFYSVQMARAAVTITRKREMWNARKNSDG